MARPEERFWHRLHGLLPRHVQTQRLTDRLALAVPDVLWTWDGVTGLTELKVAPLQARGTIVVDWRPGQPAWLWRWAHHGARAVALVHVPGHALVALDPTGHDLSWVARVHQPLALGDPLCARQLPVGSGAWPREEVTRWLRGVWTGLTPEAALTWDP